MTRVEKISVSLQFGNDSIEVGALAFSRGKIYFRYDPGFVQSGIEISPFKLPLSDNISSTDPEPFNGLFGVFNDSLPDGWGRLLVDRSLSSRGVNIGSITPLDRLAFVGMGGMGALTYRPEIETDGIRMDPDLDVIATEVRKVSGGFESDFLDELYQLGGSSGGARPKVLIAYNTITNHMIHSPGPLPDGYEYWIVKFPSSSDPEDIANIEYAYYKMASDSGIKMNDCKLFKGLTGKAYFGTRRFDRSINSRLHMHSASGLMHDNFRLSTMDYGHLMDCAFRLEKQVVAYEKVFRLACFNVFSHNRDDHSNNFAFLMNEKGEWKFAPAYDLTFSSSSHGYHATMVAGESQSPGTSHLLELAEHFDVATPKEIIDQVQNIVSGWRKYASAAGVSKGSSLNIERALQKIDK